MIKIIMDVEGICPDLGQQEISCKGTIHTTMVELVLAVTDIYNGLKIRDPAAAYGFRRVVGGMLAPDSAVWDDDVFRTQGLRTSTLQEVKHGQ